MATYRTIQDWVRRNYGWQPKTCWIAHCKELSGLTVPPASNRQGAVHQVPCPPEKQEAIFAAFKHFSMD